MSAHAMAGGQAPPFGPVQVLVLEFDRVHFKGEVMAELRRLKDAGIVRLIDLLIVQKHENGKIESIQESDLIQEEPMEFGAIASALIGLGAGGQEEAERAGAAGAAEFEDGHVFEETDMWYLGDAIPAGSIAVVALIEHRWAIPLRDKIVEAGSIALADEWIHPADLVATGLGRPKQGPVGR